jgi:ATP-dependent helicase HepA
MPVSKGQRYISDAEPELGLGIITGADTRYADVEFATANTKRRFSIASAPLRRIRFKPGDTIVDRSGSSQRITSILENPDTGLITYLCGSTRVNESDISDTVSVSTPMERLLHGKIDPPAVFDTRVAMHRFRAGILMSPVRGFTGARIEPLPHQLYIADTVSSRRIPRALLADETGLGKTIETCLIMHRLLICGRINRVLVLTPEHLSHQWFVELLRRFNLSFTLCTNDFFSSATPGANPLINEQLCIAGINDLSNSSVNSTFAVSAQWDMVIADEAHHLRHDTLGFSLLQRLTKTTPGILLLTATPEQFGRQDHFHLLQILDPVRYCRFEDYEREQASFRLLFDIIDSTLKRDNINPSGLSADTLMVDVPDSILLPIINYSGSEPDTHSETSKLWSIERLIDICGTGSMMFRNTRKTIPGFPARDVNIVVLDSDADATQRAYAEMQSDCGIQTGSDTFSGTLNDERVIWLAKFAKQNKGMKILVICATKEKSIRIHGALASSVKIDAALFHEDMTIIQRDRNAAWFGEDEGARILICSEIGSEGRNFQFCHTLVLFDLPINPELLEQRIGRLDRIGQRGIIQLYIPCVRNSPQHLLCRWYHEALNAFKTHVPAAGRVFEQMSIQLTCFCTDSGKTPDESGIQDFIEQARTLCGEYSADYTDPRDKLLGITSFRQGTAQSLVRNMNNRQSAGDTERIMTRLFDLYGIIMENAGKNKYALNTELLSDNAFPLPRSERPVVTFIRETALAREDVEFITQDHPMLTGALDLLLSSERGTSAFCLADNIDQSEIMLESVYILECGAPAGLNIAGLLPRSPVRIVVDGKGNDVTLRYPAEVISAMCVNSAAQSLIPAILAQVQDIMEKSHAIAEVQAKSTISNAVKLLHEGFKKEISRTRELDMIHHSGMADSIESIKQEMIEAEKHLTASRARLDAVRLIKGAGR